MGDFRSRGQVGGTRRETLERHHDERIGIKDRGEQVHVTFQTRGDYK